MKYTPSAESDFSEALAKVTRARGLQKLQRVAINHRMDQYRFLSSNALLSSHSLSDEATRHNNVEGNSIREICDERLKSSLSPLKHRMRRRNRLCRVRMLVVEKKIYDINLGSSRAFSLSAHVYLSDARRSMISLIPAFLGICLI